MESTQRLSNNRKNGFIKCVWQISIHLQFQERKNKFDKIERCIWLEMGDVWWWITKRRNIQNQKRCSDKDHEVIKLTHRCRCLECKCKIKLDDQEDICKKCDNGDHDQHKVHYYD